VLYQSQAIELQKMNNATFGHRDGMDSHKGAELEPKLGNRCDEKNRCPGAEDTWIYR
jgi:hypothetical protein